MSVETHARYLVAKSILAGALPRAIDLACDVCGIEANIYHHHMGYTDGHEVDVIPLCHKCHKATHLEERSKPMANNVATKPNIEKTFRRTAYKCKVCGYGWYGKGTREPHRCANPACRSQDWKRGKP